MAVLSVRQVFILTLFNNFITSSWSFINIEEIQNTKYGIEITGVPVLLKTDPDVANSLMLSSKHGQQYQCTLPELEAKESVDESKRTFTTKEVTDLLQSLENKCLHHNKGWWTYEFCYGKSVSQYHEEGSSVVGNKISLGLYSSQTEWDKEEVELPYSKNSSKRFHSQFFENGTTCDLNGAQRTTEVKFKCEVDTRDHITMVNEPSSCTYAMEIHTDKLCKHPLFKPAANQKPLPITCSPALPEERYQKYLEALEIEKKAKARAIADKIRKMQAVDDEYDDDYIDAPKPKKRKPSRSEVWPWDQIVENEDQTLLNTDIDEKTLRVNRMDIVKNRKVDEEGKVNKEDAAVTITSRYYMEDRKKAKKTVVDIIENNEETEAQTKDSTDKKQQPSNKDKKKSELDKSTFPFEKIFEALATVSDKETRTGEEKRHAESSIEENKGENKEKKANKSPEEEEKDDNKEDNKKKKKKKKKTLEEEWKDALDQARNQLRSVVRKQLKGMGVDPNELENRVKAMLGGKSSKTNDAKQDDKKEKDDKAKTEVPPTMEGMKEDVDSKLENVKKSVEQMEKDGKLDKNSNERRLLSNIQKIMQGMDHQNVVLMKKEETIQRELENHFDELRDRYNIEVDMMRRFIDEIEERGSHPGSADDGYLKTMVEKLKNSLLRFDKSNRALSDDMEAVKELNKEVHSKIDDIASGDNTGKKTTSGEYFRLAGKANLVLRRLLQRSAQLDKDMRDMKEISRQAKARDEEYADVLDEDSDISENKRLKREAEKRLGSIVDKLKKMISNDDTITTESEEPLPDTTTPTSDNFKVRVSKIKGDDGKTVWTDGKDDELSEGTGGELEIEDRLKSASKKMERMVKKQLENAGINPGGKIRVKIITSRDALENFGGKKGTDILSEEETAQFKKMIYNLMGGSSEAGDEKKRQNKIESNYNLVWSDNGMKTSPKSDEEDPDTELVFDDTDIF